MKLSFAKERLLEVLDGWRALSIILVLAGHWLALGPRDWALNGAVAASGMALFFTLSGFLIVRVLLNDSRPVPFLIRRICRIVPLAWAAMLVLFTFEAGQVEDLLANLLFVANLPPTHLMSGGEHLWSLCIEFQFYLSIAAAISIAGRRALWLIPFLAVTITITRFLEQEPRSIVTWYRIDEILASGSLALLVYRLGIAQRSLSVPKWTSVALLPLLVASGHTNTAVIMYARPYLAASIVGASIFAVPSVIRLLLCLQLVRYIAEVSYAVYVVHGLLGATWLGSGASWIKYAKRPILFAATFTIAHWSTYYFEEPAIKLGKRLSMPNRRHRDSSEVSQSPASESRRFYLTISAEPLGGSLQPDRA